MGNDFGKAAPVIGLVAGAAIGVATGGAGLGLMAMVKAGLAGAAIGGSIGGVAGSVLGGDPMEDLRNAAESQARQQEQAMQQWRDQQDKLFAYKERELGRLEPLQQQFTDQFGDILSGERDVMSSPMFSPMFGNIRQNLSGQLAQIEDRFPAGGAKERAANEIRRRYADMESQLVGNIQKWVFDKAGSLQLPYGGVGGPAPSGGGASNIAALAALRSPQFDPMAPLEIMKGYRDAFPGKTATKTTAGKTQLTGAFDNLA